MGQKSEFRRFEIDDVYEPPADKHIPIWRYMGFAKFMSMLEKRALWFCRAADLFANDPLEGSFPRANVATRREFWGPPLTPQREAAFREQWQEGPYYHFINSWGMGDHESDAMWHRYVSDGEGVALRSTYKRLRDSTVNYDGLPIHLIVVRYLDYENDSRAIPETDPLAPFAFKRTCYEHEHELRAVLQAVEYGYAWRAGDAKERTGWTVEIPLDVLIEAVVIAPNAPAWFGGLVESVTGRYDLNVEVLPSALAVEPVY
jgi:hypothetical protein